MAAVALDVDVDVGHVRCHLRVRGDVVIALVEGVHSDLPVARPLDRLLADQCIVMQGEGSKE